MWVCELNSIISLIRNKRLLNVFNDFAINYGVFNEIDIDNIIFNNSKTLIALQNITK